MYKEFLFFLIIFVSIYFIFLHDNRIQWPADDGKKYIIMDSKNSVTNTKKANMLSKINYKAQKIVELMHEENVPNSSIANKTRKRFSKNFKIKEIAKSETGSAAYTINKGGINGEMCVCLMTGDKFNNLNDIFYVILHELAHVMSDSYGHGKEFQRNFDFIVAFAVKKNLWKDQEYEKKNVNYCGVKITNSPCRGDFL